MQPMTWEGRKGNTRRRLTSPCFSLYCTSLLLSCSDLTESHTVIGNFAKTGSTSKIVPRFSKGFAKQFAATGLEAMFANFHTKYMMYTKRIDMKNKKHTHIFQQMLSLWHMVENVQKFDMFHHRSLGHFGSQHHRGGRSPWHHKTSVFHVKRSSNHQITGIKIGNHNHKPNQCWSSYHILLSTRPKPTDQRKAPKQIQKTEIRSFQSEKQHHKEQPARATDHATNTSQLAS